MITCKVSATAANCTTKLFRAAVEAVEGAGRALIVLIYLALGKYAEFVGDGKMRSQAVSMCDTVRT